VRPHTYVPIEAPKNSPAGFVTAFFAVTTGFALIWHIWWMAGVGLLGATVTWLAFMFRAEDEVEIPAEQLGRFDRAHSVEVSL
jgi:cytochrome o ubiquinol oxidase subunit 1